jgi:glucan phosphoethanolaminetransferase (alkaline phosphatase superfamily)
MEDNELKNIWLTYDKKLADAQLLNAQSWALNLRCFAEIQQKKASSKLRALTIHNIFAVLIGIVWILLLGALVWLNHFTNPYFSTSMLAILLFSLYAVFIYIRHIDIIAGIDYDNSIVETQQKLARLQASTFKSIRIIWLQLPFYTCFWWNTTFVESDPSFWYIALPVALVFLLAALFLYRNLRPENMHKKWVRSLMLAGPELKNVVKSIDFLKEVEEFKKGMM